MRIMRIKTLKICSIRTIRVPFKALEHLKHIIYSYLLIFMAIKRLLTRDRLRHRCA